MLKTSQFPHWKHDFWLYLIVRTLRVGYCFEQERKEDIFEPLFESIFHLCWVVLSESTTSFVSQKCSETDTTDGEKELMLCQPSRNVQCNWQKRICSSCNSTNKCTLTIFLFLYPARSIGMLPSLLRRWMMTCFPLCHCQWWWVGRRDCGSERKIAHVIKSKDRTNSKIFWFRILYLNQFRNRCRERERQACSTSTKYEL